MRKLPYYESLGALLEDLGFTEEFIIGNKAGMEGIDWIAVKAINLDREITLHPDKGIPIVTYRYRADGRNVLAHPSIATEDLTAYSLQSAHYDDGKVVVDCNVMMGKECKVQQIPVEELRRTLNVSNPNRWRFWLYGRPE